MVQEIELVTPGGEVIDANECQNTDYFWAMRGGGGSTYGVALAYNIRALPSVRSARYRTTLENWDEIVHWYRNWDRIASIGGSGYFDGYPGAGNTRGKSISLNFNVPNMTQAALEAVVNPDGTTCGAAEQEQRAAADAGPGRRRRPQEAEALRRRDDLHARPRGRLPRVRDLGRRKPPLESQSLARERAISSPSAAGAQAGPSSPAWSVCSRSSPPGSGPRPTCATPT